MTKLGPETIFSKGERVRKKTNNFVGSIHHEHRELKGLYIVIWDHFTSTRSRGQAWHYELERLEPDS